jgi:hypothetical protein
VEDEEEVAKKGDKGLGGEILMETEEGAGEFVAVIGEMDGVANEVDLVFDRIGEGEMILMDVGLCCFKGVGEGEDEKERGETGEEEPEGGVDVCVVLLREVAMREGLDEAELGFPTGGDDIETSLKSSEVSTEDPREKEREGVEVGASKTLSEP